jgi:ABC-2 type transport system permease protein
VTWLITRRELREIARDPNLLMPIVVMPLLMGLLAGMAAFGSAQGSQSAVGAVVGTLAVQQLPPQTLIFFANLPFGDQDKMIALLLKAVAIPLFWIVPVALTSAVAADSFVGEKERHTLEPLLATPVKDREIFFAKLMTAIIPAVLGTWLGMLAFALLVAISGSPYFPRFVLGDVDWLFSALVVVPLMALLSSGVAALISSRVSSYRAAYQLNGLLVLPVILFLIPQTIVLFLVTWRALYIVAAGIVLVDVLLVAAALALFDRERLLQSAG